LFNVSVDQGRAGPPRTVLVRVVPAAGPAMQVGDLVWPGEATRAVPGVVVSAPPGFRPFPIWRPRRWSARTRRWCWPTPGGRAEPLARHRLPECVRAGAGHADAEIRVVRGEGVRGAAPLVAAAEPQTRCGRRTTHHHRRAPRLGTRGSGRPGTGRPEPRNPGGCHRFRPGAYGSWRGVGCQLPWAVAEGYWLELTRRSAAGIRRFTTSRAMASTVLPVA